MNRAAPSGVSIRAIQEFGQALRSGPFRIALVISLILHLALLIVVGLRGQDHDDGRRIPLMRVRILPPAP